jgi:hypothetical protein
VTHTRHIIVIGPDGEAVTEFLTADLLMLYSPEEVARLAVGLGVQRGEVTHYDLEFRAERVAPQPRRDWLAAAPYGVALAGIGWAFLYGVLLQ